MKATDRGPLQALPQDYHTISIDHLPDRPGGPELLAAYLVRSYLAAHPQADDESAKIMADFLTWATGHLNEVRTSPNYFAGVDGGLRLSNGAAVVIFPPSDQTGFSPDAGVFPITTGEY